MLINTMIHLTKISLKILSTSPYHLIFLINYNHTNIVRSNMFAQIVDNLSIFNFIIAPSVHRTNPRYILGRQNNNFIELVESEFILKNDNVAWGW